MTAQTHAPAVAPIPRTIDGIADALPSAKRLQFNREARTTDLTELDQCLSKWWGEAVMEAAAPAKDLPPHDPQLSSMTVLFIERIAAGGAIDWTEMETMRARKGARYIDWAAIDRARAAAGAA